MGETAFARTDRVAAPASRRRPPRAAPRGWPSYGHHPRRGPGREHDISRRRRPLRSPGNVEHAQHASARPKEAEGEFESGGVGTAERFQRRGTHAASEWELDAGAGGEAHPADFAMEAVMDEPGDIRKARRGVNTCAH